MDIHQSTVVPMPIDAVFALMTDRDFQREKARRVSALEFDFSDTGDAHPRITTTRTMSTSNLPELIKSMLNPTMTVVETERWEAPAAADTRTGEFLIDVHGAPVSLQGRVDLVSVDDGTELTFSGTLRSSIPLFRSKIEESAAGSVTATISAEFALLHERTSSTVG